MGFLSVCSLGNFQSVVCQRISRGMYRSWDKWGPKGANFKKKKKLIFSRILMQFFAMDSLWKINIALHHQIFGNLCPFRAMRGQTGPKLQMCRLHKIFIFHQILMGFFSLDSSHCKLSVVCQWIYHSSKCFRPIRGQRGQKCNFFKYMYVKSLFFNRFRWDFSVWFPLVVSFG